MGRSFRFCFTRRAHPIDDLSAYGGTRTVRCSRSVRAGLATSANRLGRAFHGQTLHLLFASNRGIDGVL